MDESENGKEWKKGRNGRIRFTFDASRFTNNEEEKICAGDIQMNY